MISGALASNVSHSCSAKISGYQALVLWTDILEIADDTETLVSLQMLFALRVARLCAGIDTVEGPGTAFQVETQTVKMVIPVWIFDNHLTLRVYAMGWLYNHFPADLVEQIHPEITPRTITLRLDTEVALAVCEIIVVEHNLVEIAGRQFGDVLDHLQMLGIAIAETLPALALAA